MRLRDLRLKSQLSIVLIFMTAYTVVTAMSYQSVSRAQTELETSFHQDLGVLTRLPRLGDELRHVDILTDEFLLTGNPAWIKERHRLILGVRTIMTELDGLMAGEAEERLWRDIEKGLGEYLSEQDRWISRKQQGRLTIAGAVRVGADNRNFDEVMALILKMRDDNFYQLQQRRRAARNAARATFYLTLFTGLLVGVVLAVFVTNYVIDPLNKLEEYSRRWQLGGEWTLTVPDTGPEIQGLFECIGQMSTRLNEQFKHERELAQFKSQLVSLVSHEFNNALSVINGVSMLLEETEKGAEDGKRQTYYDMLKANIRSLHVASNNLLNMGRLESGKFALNVRPTRVDEIVHQAAQRLEILALRKNITMAFEFPETPIQVLADPDALSLVATNLLGNAIKYTHAKGKIAVKVRLDPGDGKRLRVSFSDTGIGVKPEDRERIFSGYFRTEQGKNEAKGFGVGLSLAKRIVEAHDSRLELESTPGKGSTFWFSLPLAA